MTKHKSLKSVTALMLLTGLLSAASIQMAQADGNAGFAAFERGDYATALKEFQPLGDEEAVGIRGVMQPQLSAGLIGTIKGQADAWKPSQQYDRPATAGTGKYRPSTA